MWVQRVPKYEHKSVSPTPDLSVNLSFIHSKKKVKARRVGKNKDSET